MAEGQDYPKNTRIVPEVTPEEEAIVLLHLRALLVKGQQPKARDIWYVIRKMKGDRVVLTLKSLVGEGRIGCANGRFFVIDNSE